MNDISGLKGRVEDRSITIIAARRVRRLLDWGDPEAQPIVLLHSLGLDHELWRPVAARLRGRFRVIAPDIAGHGRERGDALMTSIAAAADDIVAILNELGVASATIVGLSMGGAVAQEFALRHPSRTKGLGLIATMMKGAPVFAERAEKAEREGLAAQIDITLERWFTPGQIERDHEGVRYARERLNTLDARTWSAAWRSLSGHDTVDRLPSLSVPALCVAGELDPSTPPQVVKAIADRIPNSRFEIVVGAPHLLGLTHSREIETLLTQLASSIVQ